MSKPDPRALPKRDRDAAARRMRMMQALLMQGLMVVVILLMTFIARGSRRDVTLYLSSLIVPLGWAYTVWDAGRREDGAREDGRWDATLARAERKRGLGMLGIFVLSWVVAAILIFVLL